MSALAGIGYRGRYRDALLADAGGAGAGTGARPAVLEIMPDHFFDDPDAATTLAMLAERYAIVFHDVGMSLGTAGDVASARTRLRAIARLAAIARPFAFGEHLALTRSPSGTELGHLAPLWYTRELLEVLVARVRAVQDVLGVPVLVENIAAPFTIPGADFSEAELVCELVARTGCGLVLDLTNLLYSARNAGEDPVAQLARYPLEAVQQIHLAGGLEHGGVWIDTHSEPVDQGSLGLLRHLQRARGRVRAIVVERDAKLPPLDTLVAEARRAATLFEETTAC